MRVVGDHAEQVPLDRKGADSLCHADRDSRERQSLGRRGLPENSALVKRGRATVLAVATGFLSAIPVVVAMHRPAALHRLLRRGHAKTVRSIGRDCHDQECSGNPFSRPHHRRRQG